MITQPQFINPLVLPSLTTIYFISVSTCRLLNFITNLNTGDNNPGIMSLRPENIFQSIKALFSPTDLKYEGQYSSRGHCIYTYHAVNQFHFLMAKIARPWLGQKQFYSKRCQREHNKLCYRHQILCVQPGNSRTESSGPPKLSRLFFITQRKFKKPAAGRSISIVASN